MTGVSARLVFSVWEKRKLDCWALESSTVNPSVRVCRNCENTFAASAKEAFSVKLLANCAAITTVSAGLEFSVMDCKNVDNCVLKSSGANNSLMVAVNNALPVISMSFSVMASTWLNRKAACWTLKSAEPKSSVMAKAKLVPARDANGTWAKLATPNTLSQPSICFLTLLGTAPHQAQFASEYIFL